MDPFQGLATFILGKLKDSTVALWWRLLFELAFSAVVSFLIICGTLLVTTNSPTEAIGGGMIASAVSMTVLFRRESSRLTKGMLVVLPQIEATKELETDEQIIEKSK